MANEENDGVERILMGGDELHRVYRRVRTFNQKSFTPEVFRKELFAEDFWPSLERLRDQCDDILEGDGFPRSRWRIHYKDNIWCLIETNDDDECAYQLGASRGKGCHYAKERTEYYTDAWYAAQITSLLWIVLDSRNNTAPVHLNRILNLGKLLKDWEWRQDFKPEILRYRAQIASRRANAPKGGAVKRERAEMARERLAVLALEPSNFEVLKSRSDKQKVSHLQKLARDYDLTQPDDEKLFQNNKGKALSRKWFEQRLDDWYANNFFANT